MTSSKPSASLERTDVNRAVVLDSLEGAPRGASVVIVIAESRIREISRLREDRDAYLLFAVSGEPVDVFSTMAPWTNGLPGGMFDDAESAIAFYSKLGIPLEVRDVSDLVSTPSDRAPIHSGTND